MDIVYGNLVDVVEANPHNWTEHIVVIHNANCQCRMGAGAARAIAMAWPEVEIADQMTGRGDRDKLGHWSMASVEISESYTISVHNLYCQYRYGPAYEQHFDYEAFNIACQRLADYYKGMNVRFVFPLIGTGHAGGRWSRIRDTLLRELKDFPMTLVKLSPNAT